MIDYQQQLKLQAYADGELSGREAEEIAAWIAADREASALFAELSNTHKALAGFEETIRVPESRDFYWSKISRAIEAQERVATEATPVPLLAQLRRFLIPTAGIALAALVALMVIRQPGGSQDDNTVALEDTQAFTYHDFSSGTTLVWLSYPADKHMPGEDELTVLE